MPDLPPFLLLFSFIIQQGREKRDGWLENFILNREDCVVVRCEMNGSMRCVCTLLFMLEEQKGNNVLLGVNETVWRQRLTQIRQCAFGITDTGDHVFHMNFWRVWEKCNLGSHIRNKKNSKKEYRSAAYSSSFRSLSWIIDFHDINMLVIK